MNDATNGSAPASDHEATTPAAAAELPGASDAPDNGIVAGKKLMEYAEALAEYCEQTGEEKFNEADSFRNECKMLAASYRESASIMAQRAVEFTVSLRKAGLTIQQLRNGTVTEGQQ